MEQIGGLVSIYYNYPFGFTWVPQNITNYWSLMIKYQLKMSSMPIRPLLLLMVIFTAPKWTELKRTHCMVTLFITMYTHWEIPCQQWTLLLTLAYWLVCYKRIKTVIEWHVVLLPYALFCSFHSYNWHTACAGPIILITNNNNWSAEITEMLF